jgi:thioester reductase-like protein
MATIFFTGFPGFLGSRLLPGVVARREGARAVCLVQGKFAALAQRRAAELIAAHPGLAGRLHLVEGDITRPGLGLDPAERSALAADLAEVYHLAAIYDLAVAREPALAVNLEGTRNVLEFAAAGPALSRFHHVSTCYVSGCHPGLFREDDLDVGQKFNNHYEETKFLAEVEVQERIRGGLPATVYRPAIAVGDSRTGETQKFDGPYYVIRWVLRQPPVALVPVVGDTKAYRVNVVPSDFVIAAIDHLSGIEASAGVVYQLADPAPATVDEILDLLAEVTGRRIVRLRLPLGLAKGALDYVPFLERFLGIPSASVDYFVHPTEYATDHTRRDLAGTGIACPPLPSYIDRLVAFAREHPEIGAAAMA